MICPLILSPKENSLKFLLCSLTTGGGSGISRIVGGSSTSTRRETKVKVSKPTRKGGERLSCNFPRLNPFDPSITDFIKSPPAIDCRKSYPLVFRTNFQNKLIQWGHPFPSSGIERQIREDERLDNTDNRNYNCCYKTITRGNGSDYNVV